MKIYIVCDLEGTAGVADHIHQCCFVHDSYEAEYKPGIFGPFYQQARRLATLELNALVEGALEAGAEQIVAWDGHCRFPGGLDVELLHPECQLVMNAGDGGPAGLDETYDALLMLGLHARQGTPAAPQAHMLFPGLEWKGEPVGEIGITCATAAWLGIPTIFVSGDRAAIEETRLYVPNVETVITKEPLFTHTAHVSDAVPLLSLSPEKARQQIRAGARRALERLSEFALMEKPPFNPLEN